MEEKERWKMFKLGRRIKKDDMKNMKWFCSSEFDIEMNGVHLLVIYYSYVEVWFLIFFVIFCLFFFFFYLQTHH